MSAKEATFKDKTVLITGATGKIGRTIAWELSRAGATVIGLGRREDVGRTLVNDLKAAGGQADFVTCDLSNLGGFETTIKSAVERTGEIDVVVNNAAAIDAIRASAGMGVAEAPLGNFDRFMKVGVYAPLVLAQSTIPGMIRRGGGVFVHVSSMAGVRAHKGLAGYGPSKAALEMLSHQIAVDYGVYRIRSNVLRLGGVLNDDNSAMFDDSTTGPFFRRSQMLEHRFGEADDVAQAVAFLASDKASFFTGTVLVVDGGGGAKMTLPEFT